MATYTDTLGFNKGSAAPNAKGVNRVRVEKVKLDFAAIVAARSAAGATALAAADVLNVLHIPAKTQVLASGAQVTSAETTNTTCTFDTGDGTDPNGWAAALASNALGSESNTTYSQVYYNAADTIDITINTAAPTDCVLEVWAVMADCS